MRIRFGTFICCLGVFGATLQAQTTKDVQRMLQDSLLKQQVYLRNLSAQSHVNAHWDGNKVVLAMPYVYMLSGILVTSVKVDSKHIEIRGVRHQLVNDPVKGWALAAAPSDVVIVVALNGGDLAAIRPVLRDELFFPSLQNAIAAVPDDFAGPPLVIDAHNGSAQPPNPSLPTCDCADVDLKVCKKDHRQIVGETPATVIKMGQPQFPEEARLANVVRATIGIHLKVNAAGLPTFLWISKAAGYGLDENVAIAIGSSKFKPATCHGQPVPEDPYIEFNVER